MKRKRCSEKEKGGGSLEKYLVIRLVGFTIAEIKKRKRGEKRKRKEEVSLTKIIRSISPIPNGGKTKIDNLRRIQTIGGRARRGGDFLKGWKKSR